MAIGSASRAAVSQAALAGLLALATFLLDYVGLLWKPRIRCVAVAVSLLIVRLIW